jgi:hypothetical protein
VASSTRRWRQQAGEEAYISSALPIAQQDANTYATFQGRNQDATNAFSMTDKTFENSQALADYQQQAARAAQAEGSNQRLNEGEQNYQNSNSMFERDNALKEKLTMESLASQERQANIGASATISAAGAHAGATVQAAQISAASQAALAAMDGNLRREAMNLDAATRLQITNITTDAQRAAAMAGLQQNTLTNFGGQMSSIMAAQMEPGDRQNALNNLSALYGGSPYLPVGINFSAFNSGSTTPTGLGGIINTVGGGPPTGDGGG